MKQLYICWVEGVDVVPDPAAVTADSPHAVMDYNGDEAACRYAQTRWHEASGTLGESFEVEVYEVSSKDRGSYAVLVDYKPTFDVLQVEKPS
jgi:hypothetical protein